MDQQQLAHEYEDFRHRTSAHLWVCPLVSDAVEPPPPNRGPLKAHETANLRATAALLRTEEEARPNLTETASGALAALYDAYADLGEVLCDEAGGTWLWETSQPTDPQDSDSHGAHTPPDDATALAAQQSVRRCSTRSSTSTERLRGVPRDELAAHG